MKCIRHLLKGGGTVPWVILKFIFEQKNVAMRIGLTLFGIGSSDGVLL